MLHDYLVVADDAGARRAQLVTEPLSIERGTWRVNADGTMDTTWKLRPNVKWHDGTPFTAEDMLFSFNVYKDPEIPNRAGAAVQAMASASAPDPQTFVVRWSRVYVDADQAVGLVPMPRHLLEDTYRNEKAGFVNSPLFTSEFVGLGPYRLVKWESGAHMDLARFDDYYQGRPPLDTVLVRFLDDPNTMVANILSGNVDVVLPEGVDLDAAVEVRRRWEGTGNQVFVGLTGALRHVEIQHRPDYAQPRNGMTVRAVRQALYHATDRQALADVMNHGLAPAADSWFPPNHELYPQVQASIPQFPYDLNRAQALLAQAGWTRGPDGILVHQPSGERFELEARNAAGSGAEKSINVLVEGWKASGVQVNINIIPRALSADREYRGTLPGAGVTALRYETLWADRLHSTQASSPANRWAGVTRPGYSNPRVDTLLDQLASTIPPSERLALHRQLLQEAFSDVALIPLYWELSPVLALQGVKNIGKHAGNINTWNMFDWDVDPVAPR
jgi:peptide/nickel transport system substrate-binding protein